jgi:hypothetical protein
MLSRPLEKAVMTNRPEYVQIANGEDVNSVRDRLSFSRGKRVLLIWPEEGTTLTRKLDLVLVQREAKRRAIQIALVTHDERVMEHARDLGISTFETVGSSERGRWKRGSSRLFTNRDDRPEDAPEPDDLKDVASRVHKRHRVSGGRALIVRLLVIAGVIAIIGGVAYVVMPTATIKLEISKQILQTNIEIVADPTIKDVDVDQRLVPATDLKATVQTVGTLSTTGVQNLSDSVAIGVVVFTNQTGRTVEIPAGTSVSTSAGTPISFKTVAPAAVPAGEGERTEVAVEALQTGNVGNVDVGLINTVVGPLEDEVTVRNLSPTTGGESRSFASVTAEDQERLLAIVRGNLQATAYAEMQAQLTDTQLIVIETIRIPPEGERQDWTNFSHQIGDITDTLSLDMRAVVEAIAIDDRFARQIIFADLSARKPTQLLLLPETFQYTRGGVIEIQPGNRVVFNASGQAVITATLNEALLRDQLIGHTREEALYILANAAILAPDAMPEIHIEPEWLPTLPLLPIRIQFQVMN